jgi:putative DNA primase/helicase
LIKAILPNSAPNPEPVAPVPFSEDDHGNEFVNKCNGNVVYVEEISQWFMYNGTYWEPISTLTMVDSARQLNRELAATIDVKSEKARGLKRQLGSHRFSSKVVAFAQGDNRCLLSIAELDTDPWLLGTPGGIVDLRTGKYIGKGQRPYVTMVTSAAPADKADEKSCPLFLRFMDEFTCGDADLKRFLLQYAGYCLTGNMREQCLIFLFGDSDNGKTVFIRMLRKILNDYVINAALDLFVASQGTRHNTVFADLHRRRLVIANETQEGQTLRLDKVKDITGQEPIRANFMRKDSFEFLPVCKLIMFGNYKPRLPDIGKSVKKRIRMVPCNLQLKAGQMDKELMDKMIEEAPGIQRAFIDRCLDWQKNGLILPKCVARETNTYFDAQDMIGVWLEECCIVAFSAKEQSTVAWQSWKSRNIAPGTEMEFADRLKAREFKKLDHVPGPNGRRPRGWQGFRLRGSNEYKAEDAKDTAEDGRPEPPPHTEYPEEPEPRPAGVSWKRDGDGGTPAWKPPPDDGQ